MSKVKRTMLEVVRCAWPGLSSDPVYQTYHDEEWAQPQLNSHGLFEMLCLEGQQAGLAWITILKKRPRYRQVFFDFDPYKVARITPNKVNELIIDSGIVKHRGKIEAIINNAECYLAMEENGESFSEFIWSFVGNKQIVNTWEAYSEVPAQTPASIAMSKALKERNFKFIGPTTCYAFMQACGLVNDHVVNCWCHPKYKKSKK